MADTVKFIITSDRSAEVYAALHREIVQAVVDTAKDGKSEGQANCPVRSGYMRSTYYVDAEGYSDYGQDVTTAPQGASLLPPEHHEKDTQAVIGIAASYGIYPELGTERAAAQPSLAPAVVNAQDKLMQRLAAIDGRLR